MIKLGKTFLQAMTSTRTYAGVFITAAIVFASSCLAADGPTAASTDIPSAAVQTSNPAPYLQAILGQLVEMHHELDQTRAMEDLPHTCKYEARGFTEGAIVKVGNLSLVCVSPSRLVMPGTVNGKRVAEAHRKGEFDEQPTRCIWEPLNSPRIEHYRKLVGLPTSVR